MPQLSYFEKGTIAEKIFRMRFKVSVPMHLYIQTTLKRFYC